ncbi:hypothetical protein DFH27DRAFT_212881 [Peziza echinospora]|nr:hypothetical protein DFH27DRAFT_212881 [Peziza echinospora]
MAAPLRFHALLTGANSGLGLSLCTRFLSEFLTTRPAHHHITLIFTTRSPSKSAATASTIVSYLHANGLDLSRVVLRPAFVDLSQLSSVLSLADELLGRKGARTENSAVDKLDWVFLNAGILSTTTPGRGVDWPLAIYHVVTNPLHALTTPEYKIQVPSEVVLQIPPSSSGKTTTCPPEVTASEDGLGYLFCSNVFGHYVLVNLLQPLLTRKKNSPHPRARVVWTSSLEANPACYTPTDIQCLQGTHPYESSKYLTDVLALTHESSPSAKATCADKDILRPRYLLTHPAVCATGISNLPPVLWYLMLAAFYIARVAFGSEWHPIDSWKGNVATMHVALHASEEELDGRTGKIKWGAGATRWGKEFVKETKINGVGEDGTLDENMKKLGEESWMEIESLRKLWMKRLGRK